MAQRKSALGSGTIWERRPSKGMKRCGDELADAKVCAEVRFGTVLRISSGLSLIESQGCYNLADFEKRTVSGRSWPRSAFSTI